MLSPINILIALLWLISATVDYANFCYIWQLKEYRWDRFRDFLSTYEGKNFWVQYPLLWRSLLAILIFLWPINATLVIKYFLISIFTVDALHALYKYLAKALRRPVITKKAVLILILSIGIEGLAFLYTHDWALIFLLLILRFVFLSVIVLLLNLPTRLAKKYYIKKATKKISQYPNLIVIGITGSYAKSTVKSFLGQILDNRFKVISTPKNINTEIGIASFILKTDLTNIDVFIVEMGAYCEGEIKLICDMVKPKIGILTAINEQHLSLFGNIKNTQTAKYELLRSLPKTGLAITNADNPYCTEYLDELTCTVKTFGLEKDSQADLLITEISSSKDGIHCQGFLEGKACECFAPIQGEYNVVNIATCILAALFLDLTKEEINKQIRKLKIPAGILSVYKYGNCEIIDDSYNSNPDGFKAILGVLNKYPSDRKRIIITRGMSELGDKSEELHEIIGEEISFVADELVIIKKDFYEPLKKGTLDKYHINRVTKFEPKELLAYVKNLRNTNAVILLENRIPKVVADELGSEQSNHL